MEKTEEELNIDIDDIGTILKSSRLKSKKSLEEISSELCIRKIYLTALEESDYETLPPVPYGIGYVRTYARYLGLSPERAVKLYKAAAFAEETEKEENIVAEPEINKSNKTHVIVGVIALALVYGIWNAYVSNTSSKTPVVVAENSEITEATQTIEDMPATESANVDEDVTEKEIKTEEVSVEGEKAMTTEEQEKQVVANDKVVILKFNGDCWIRVQDKKKVYIERVYHKGDIKEFPYAENMFISIGLPKNVKIYIRGEEKSLLGTKKKMNIPLDSL